jgi:hypothetical protein
MVKVKKVSFMANGKKVSFPVHPGRRATKISPVGGSSYVKECRKEARQHPWMKPSEVERVVRDHHGRRY